jgi:ABC-type transport system involved in Fe-S cluster assembly fused permease/ATPase subunit
LPINDCLAGTSGIITMTINTLVRFMWLQDRRTRISIIMACMLTLAVIAVTMCVPLVFKEIIIRLSSQTASSYQFLPIILVGYGIIWALSNILPLLRSLILVYVFEKTVRSLSMSLLKHILSLSMRYHHNQATGSIAHSIERAQTGLEIIFWGAISFLIPICCHILLVSLIIGYLYGIIYAGLLLLAVTFYMMLSILVADKASKAREWENQARAEASATFIDSLLTIETIKYFNNQLHEYAQFNKKLHDKEQAAYYYFSLDTKIQIAQMLFMSVILGVITWVSGYEVFYGRMMLGDFILINGYLLQIILPLNHIGYTIQQVRKGIEDMKAVLSIFSATPEIGESSQCATMIFKKPSIIFDNVCFSYTKERIILQNISFSIEAGKKVAIVGPTGSGKSTIARLLLRLYDVSTGQIFIEGHDIRTLSLLSLTNSIGIVPQDTHLFNHSIYYNIAYGNPNASEKEVKQAAQLAQLQEFISSLPQGYATLVGERGLKLSGGEKQRIAIARALLKKPKVFIFDEATSSLDMKTEQEIQNNLAYISQGTTTLIIAHRLSTIKDADTILVIDKGTIVQQGTHHKLLQESGIYHSLWSQQKSSNILQYTQQPYVSL